MALPTEQLTAIGERFIASMNERDYATAAALYAPDATYESASLLEQGHTDGRIAGRERIMSHFMEALDGDDDFRLSMLDQFTGLDLTLVVSSMDGRTFIDVLRIDEDGLIAEHVEVSPKLSPIDYLSTR